MSQSSGKPGAGIMRQQEDGEWRGALLLAGAAVAVGLLWVIWATLGDEVARYLSRDPAISPGTWGDTFGALNTLLSAMGWIALLLSLAESRKATAAAIDANRIASSSRRAWIRINEVRLSPNNEFVVATSKDRAMFGIVIDAENVGETPAFRTTYQISTSIFRGSADNDSFQQLHRERAKPTGTEYLVFPGKQVSGNMGYFLQVDTSSLSDPIPDVQSHSDNALLIVVGVEAVYFVQDDPRPHSSGSFYLVWPNHEVLQGQVPSSISSSFSPPPWAN